MSAYYRFQPVECVESGASDENGFSNDPPAEPSTLLTK